MISFLLTEDAKNEARNLLKKMEENQSVSFPPSPEYPLSMVKDGNMFGVLIAETKGGERKVLYGYSGAIQGHYDVPGFVHSCYSAKDFQVIFDKYDARIHALTDQIEKEGREDLKEERRALSNTAQKEIEKIFVFSKWNGERMHGLPPRPRTGTGECAGLKLINTALRKGWEMKGLAEFRYHKDREPEFLPPCEERCGTLLPDMLGLKFLYADEDIAVVEKKSG
ncbi:MAG: hypothetical protein KBS81_00345, partial [Spirochaetales bacterium]|nr:hypothetical protein [Candidatus Physcosoma equi]